MSDFELYEKIERYLKGDMSVEEAEIFKKEISNNPRLAESVKMHRLEWDTMEALIEQDLRQKMAGWKKFNDEDVPLLIPSEEVPLLKPYINRPVFSRNIWVAAASVVMVAAASFWFFNQPNPAATGMAKINPPGKSLPSQDSSPIPSTPRPTLSHPGNAAIPSSPTVAAAKKPVLEKHVPPNPNVPTSTSKSDYLQDVAVAREAFAKNDDFPKYEDQATKGADPADGISQADSLLTEAWKAYDQKDYNKTIRILKNTAIEDAHFTALGILGRAYFYAGNYQAATPVFQNLLRLSGKKSKEESEWLLLLAYLANGARQSEQFGALANKILANKDHFYHETTRQIVFPEQK